MTNKYLVYLDDLKYLSDYKKSGVSSFLFPLESFSIGFHHTYRLDEIKKINEPAVLLINRLLDTTDIDKLNEIKELPNNINAIIIEDIGAINVLKKFNKRIILWQNHLGTNYETINYFLDYVDSVVLSSEITKDEINEILNKVKSKVSLLSFGYPEIMYSRRTLLSNYAKEYNLDKVSEMEITEKVSRDEFTISEYDKGTIISPNSLFATHDFDNEDKIEYLIVNTNNACFNDVISYLNNKDINATDGFLNKKTIYKVGGKND